MRYKKFLLLLVSVLSSVVLALLGSAFVITHDFEAIGEKSILRYIVDREIRNIPIIKEGAGIVYKSYPVDGTSRGFDSVRLKVNDKSNSYDKTVDYFLGLGYARERNGDLSRDGDEITIEQTESYIEVIKYSWN